MNDCIHDLFQVGNKVVNDARSVSAKLERYLPDIRYGTGRKGRREGGGLEKHESGGAEESALKVNAAVSNAHFYAVLTFFFPARPLRFQPMSGDPVNVNILKRGSTVKRSADSRVQGRMENAPGGSSGALESISPMISAPTGVLDAGFMTKGHPTASAGAILCAARLRGKLKGEIMEMGPIGKRLTMDENPRMKSDDSEGDKS